MDESGHNQRMLRAALVCFLVLAAWQMFFAPKPKKKIAQPAAQEQTKTGTASAGQLAERGNLGLVATGSSTAAQAQMPQVSPETFEFSGEVSTGGTDSRAIQYRLMLSNVGGGIESFTLPTYRERDTSNQPTDEPVTLAVPAASNADLGAQMAGIEFLPGTTFAYPAKPVYQVAEKSANGVRYRYVTAEGVEIEREYSLKKDSFEIELAVTIRNGSSQPQRHQLLINTARVATPAMESGGFFLMPPPDHLNGTCYTDGKVRRESQKDLAEEARTYSEGVKWAAIDRQYFLAAIVQRDGAGATCKMSGRDKLARSSLALPETTLQPGEAKRHKFTAYLGVKKPELLTRLDAQLESAIDYTILGLNLSWICQGLLKVLGIFHGLTGSWGLAILGLTILVKLALFPLNQRAGKSMKGMAKLKPELDKLKERFPDDRQRQAEEQMKLFREHGVNPAGGCVPLLIQMPIWFALYRSLWVSVDLYQQPFMWLLDLTSADPYWILPIALTAVMFIQQKMTPSTMDPAQQKVMLYFMPLMFGLMMAALPAGLSFYIFVNTVLTILQQHFINRSVSPSVQEATA